MFSKKQSYLPSSSKSSVVAVSKESVTILLRFLWDMNNSAGNWGAVAGGPGGPGAPGGPGSPGLPSGPGDPFGPTGPSGPGGPGGPISPFAPACPMGP